MINVSDLRRGIGIELDNKIEAVIELQHIKGGRIKALMVSGNKRNPAFPDVPTLKEQGINWTMGAWRGIALPKGTSPEIVAVYEKALDKVVKSKEFVEKGAEVYSKA